MKSISLTQPWASLCVLTDIVGTAHKQFETRSWKPSDKMMREIGDEPLAIHAAQGFPKAAKEFARTNQFVQQVLRFHKLNSIDDLPRGAIIGTVDIYRFVRTEQVRVLLEEQEAAFGDYSDGRWAWQLVLPKALETPIPCRGALSLWQVPAGIEKEICK